MDENKIVSDIKEDDLNKTLYKIKELKFDVKEIKNELNLDIEIYKKYKENHIIILLNGKFYTFHPQSRIIQFIDGKNVTEKFIYSNKNLAETLDSLKFKSFTIDKEGKSFDSIESEISKEEINSIFEDKSMVGIIILKTERN